VLWTLTCAVQPCHIRDDTRNEQQERSRSKGAARQLDSVNPAPDVESRNPQSSLFVQFKKLSWMPANLVNEGWHQCGGIIPGLSNASAIKWQRFWHQRHQLRQAQCWSWHYQCSQKYHLFRLFKLICGWNLPPVASELLLPRLQHPKQGHQPVHHRTTETMMRPILSCVRFVGRWKSQARNQAGGAVAPAAHC